MKIYLFIIILKKPKKSKTPKKPKKPRVFSLKKPKNPRKNPVEKNE